jgi:hypothetical protein
MISALGTVATSAWNFGLQISNLWVSHPARLRYGRNDAMTSPGARKVMPVRSRFRGFTVPNRSPIVQPPIEVWRGGKSKMKFAFLLVGVTYR